MATPSEPGSSLSAPALASLESPAAAATNAPGAAAALVMASPGPGETAAGKKKEEEATAAAADEEAAARAAEFAKNKKAKTVEDEKKEADAAEEAKNTEEKTVAVEDENNKSPASPQAEAAEDEKIETQKTVKGKKKPEAEAAAQKKQRPPRMRRRTLLRLQIGFEIPVNYRITDQFKSHHRGPNRGGLYLKMVRLVFHASRVLPTHLEHWPSRLDVLGDSLLLGTYRLIAGCLAVGARVQNQCSKVFGKLLAP